MTEEGEKLAKDITGTRRSWRGKRVLLEQEFSDLMPIPPLELKQGQICPEGRSNIRDFIKQEKERTITKGSTETASARAVYKPAQERTIQAARGKQQRQWAKWAQWLAQEIRAGMDGCTLAYNNDNYIRATFSWIGDNYIIPRMVKHNEGQRGIHEKRDG